MSNPQNIPEKNLAAIPESKTIQNVRPGKPGKYTEQADKQPTIILTLSAEAVPIGVIKMEGNMPGFKVFFKTGDDDFTPVTKPGTDDPQVNFPNALNNLH